MYKNNKKNEKILSTFCFSQKVEKSGEIWYTFYNLGIKGVTMPAAFSCIERHNLQRKTVW